MSLEHAPQRDRRRVQLSQTLELRRVVSLPQASELSGISVDTIKRRHADKIIQLSPRRKGMRLGDVLAIGTESASL